MNTNSEAAEGRGEGETDDSKNIYRKIQISLNETRGEKSERACRKENLCAAFFFFSIEIIIIVFSFPV